MIFGKKKDIEHFYLDNGFEVVLENIPERISTAVSLWIPIGSRTETKSQGGFCHFSEHMLFKGTTTRSYSDISRQVERLGGDINASTSREITRYYIRINRKFIETAFDILSDIFFHSIFPDLEFETEKKVILEEIKMGEDTPDDYLFDVFYQNVFGKKSLGNPIAGSQQSIAASTRKKLFDFYQNLYGCQGSVISISGGLWRSRSEKKKFIALLRRFFEVPCKLKGHPQLPIDKAPERVKGGVFHENKKLEQLHYAFGLPGISLRHKNSAFLSVFTHLMGGSMSSRLFKSLREENGFCYSVSAFQAGYSNEGLWGVYVGTSPQYLEKSFQTLMQEISIAVKGEIPVEEVEEAKSGLAAYLELSMESPMRRAVYNANSLLFFKRLRDWQEKVTEIESCRAEDIWQKINELWQKEKFNFTSLGNPTKTRVEQTVKKYNLEILKN